MIIPVLTQHYAMLQRNLLYTGVTRGKKLVVLVGQKKAVAIAVRNVSGRKRWSKLSEWLRPKPPVSQQIRHGQLSHGHRGLFAEAPDSMASSRPGRCSPGATASVFATEEPSAGTKQPEVQADLVANALHGLTFGEQSLLGHS